MEHKTLSVEDRKELKKGAAGRLRRQGKIPAVIYGRNEPVSIIVDGKEFEHKFHNVSESTIIKLEMGSKSWDVLVKDFQDDPFKGRINHIDFYEIERGKVLRTRVPIHTAGSPVGVREGGILEVLSHELEIECLPKDLPEEITVDVSALIIGNSIHVGDIQAPDGVKILTSNEQVIALVAAKVEEVAAPVAGEGEAAEAALVGEEEGAEGEAEEGEE
ncbi:MAG: 50S ribosomal protein L25 [Spirochaetales bacterium]|nr:50S ribosomal protein L25 [Spirochaetales bacterium]